MSIRTMTITMSLILISSVVTTHPRAEIAKTVGETVLNKFSTDLMKNLIEFEQSNVVISPTSIELVLRMAQIGAEGNTLDAFSEVIGPLKSHLGNDRSLIDDVTRKLDYIDSKISIVNSFYFEKTLPVQETYLKETDAALGTRPEKVDLKNDPEGVRSYINKSVEKNTFGLVKNLIAAGVLSKETMSVLVNSIYLKLAWEREFKSAENKKMDFQVELKKKISVVMMKQQIWADYFKSGNVEAVRFPLTDGRFISEFVLPKMGTKESDILDQIQNDIFENKQNLFEQVDLTFEVPKFKVVHQNDIQRALEKSSLRGVLQGKLTDFGKITKAVPLRADKIIHKTSFEVNETGIEAAAATAMVARAGGLPVPPKKIVQLRLDRPFFFILRAQKTGHILFFAYIRNPQAEVVM